ncbi:carbohydrate kinase [Paenibacillus chitinolyticus]|uniref:Carbohydrate kinase n=1 Tax=Paenibacillus chitinolyticus TaxID=79263 RepID=A0A410WUW5_9BACL|nr:PfkB family carbohydrate kinase [Paenibacillus chitinolyticus]MCY9594072.1 PfkB family carbohydrate kinase [Paenibacillus chitinolyticus]MCY9596157.1 PfkB family carbohydrate kinase [Paenibacillus chitinolyticus]QAV18111.1 carbohydrate kinase [Paenibacillus chitinolyticus]
MYDVVSLGELLIDFTPVGVSDNGNTLFETNPGGAPANVLAVLSRYGHKTAFIGKVGDDQLGHFLGKVLENNHIDARGLSYANNVNTTLAFVHLDKAGDRSFHFYRSPGADMMLSEDEVDLTLLNNAKVLHFGSLSMTHEMVKKATLKAVAAANEKGILVSYDPNLRPLLWDSLERAKETIIEGMQYADIVKISEEELLFITGLTDLEKGSRELVERFHLKLLLITLGDKGCFYRLKHETGYVKAKSVNAVDTTGAGDIFLGSLLHKILEKKITLELLTPGIIEEMISFANIAAGLSTTQKGAIPAIPELDDVNKIFEDNV